MRVNLGHCWESHRAGRDVQVEWNSDLLQNGHTLIMGPSGSGKTFQLRSFIRQLSEANTNARVHVFDVHGDIAIPGASEVVFSQSTPFGLNPLVVSSHPDFGGVNKCISAFLRTISKVSGNLGPRQLALIRNLLLDVYRARGFDPERPETWEVDEAQAHYLGEGTSGRTYLNIPYKDNAAAKAVANIGWDRNMRGPGFEKGCWWVATEEYVGAITQWQPAIVGRMHPNLEDVLAHVRRQRTIAFMGSDQKAVHAFDVYRRAARAYQRAELEEVRKATSRGPDYLFAQEEKARAGEKALETYREFLVTIRTGDELEDILKYDKATGLDAIIDRLETLRASGVFKNKPAPFDPNAKVWRYRLESLDREEKIMFVLFKLRELYNDAVKRGPVNQLHDVLVPDEAHLFVDEDGEDMLSVLGREARKFGVAIVAANQDPLLPKNFITSLATKIVLGIAPEYSAQAISKMGIPADKLKWVSPKKSMLVQMQDSSADAGKWRGVFFKKPGAVGNISVTEGRVAVSQGE